MCVKCKKFNIPSLGLLKPIKCSKIILNYLGSIQPHYSYCAKTICT